MFLRKNGLSIEIWHLNGFFMYSINISYHSWSIQIIKTYNVMLLILRFKGNTYKYIDDFGEDLGLNLLSPECVSFSFSIGPPVLVS